MAMECFLPEIHTASGPLMPNDRPFWRIGLGELSTAVYWPGCSWSFAKKDEATLSGDGRSSPPKRQGGCIGALRLVLLHWSSYTGPLTADDMAIVSFSATTRRRRGQ